MDRKTIFMAASKISLGIFAVYAIIFGIVSYIDFYLQYSRPPALPVGSHYSFRFFFLPMAVPLISGYFYIRERGQKYRFTSYFIVTAIILIFFFWFLYSNYHDSLKPFTYQSENIRLIMLDKTLEFLFFSSVSYFLFAPLAFSLWMWRRKFSLFLLSIVLVTMFMGVVDPGYSRVFDLLHMLPRVIALPIVVLLFLPLSEPPLPLSSVGIIYNFYVFWVSLESPTEKE